MNFYYYTPKAADFRWFLSKTVLLSLFQFATQFHNFFLLIWNTTQPLGPPQLCLLPRLPSTSTAATAFIVHSPTATARSPQAHRGMRLAAISTALSPSALWQWPVPRSPTPSAPSAPAAAPPLSDASASKRSSLSPPAYPVIKWTSSIPLVLLPASIKSDAVLLPLGFQLLIFLYSRIRVIECFKIVPCEKLFSFIGLSVAVSIHFLTILENLEPPPSKEQGSQLRS